MPSARLLTAQRFIAHFETLDRSLLESLLHETYTHTFHPKSIGPLSENVYDKAGFLTHGAGLSSIMTGFPVYAKEYVESESSNQVVVYATSKTHFREEVKDDGIPKEDWEYGGEYVFIFTMDDSGEQIVRCLEFLDSKATERLIWLMERAKGNLKKQDSHLQK
ncbi:hypothetical protein BJY04DRAFT_141704 [Aspergillus karnatakaensis]|uniref:nuclear transport factor 2 family protein n=1 Tax=Aspergillus karnatakaensis TaxID=1810916 RepID=UPI003CCCD6B3